MIETQGNIPVHIGVNDLKTLCFYTVLPSFAKWSMGYHLEIEDVKLRDKKWVEFVERVPDKDAIADQFFQFIGKGSRIRKFKGGQAELVLEIEYDKYCKINEHRELEEDKRQEVDEDCVVGQKRHRATLSHDHGPQASGSHVTLEAPVPAVRPTDHTFPTPVLLPPSLHQETSASSTHDAARVNTYHWQKSVKIMLQSSKIVCTAFIV